MTLAKTTREVSDEHENHLAKMLEKFAGRRSPSSGAVFSDPNDVTSDIYVVECKATEKKSISVKLSDWEGIRKKAFGGRKPMLAFRFRDPYWKKHTDLVMIELRDFQDLIECYYEHNTY